MRGEEEGEGEEGGEKHVRKCGVRQWVSVGAEYWTERELENLRSQWGEAWGLLRQDSAAVMREIVSSPGGKHFHPARHALARSLLVRGREGDIEVAKKELGFLFQTGKSAFTLNVWEITATVKSRCVPLSHTSLNDALSAPRRTWGSCSKLKSPRLYSTVLCRSGFRA